MKDLILVGVSDPPELFDRLLERVRPVAEVFSVTVLTGDLLTFRHVQGRDAFGQVRDAAHRFAEALSPSRAPEGLKRFASASLETKVWCHILGALSVDGISANQFLEFQLVAPVVFDSMLESVKLGIVNCLTTAETAAIDASKKGSRSRCCGATGSRYRGMCGDAILES